MYNLFLTFFFKWLQFTGFCKGLWKHHQALGRSTSRQNDGRRSLKGCPSGSTGAVSDLSSKYCFYNRLFGDVLLYVWWLFYISEKKHDVETGWKQVQQLWHAGWLSVIHQHTVFSCHKKVSFVGLPLTDLFDALCIFIQMSDGVGLGESSSVLDFMSLKSYPDMSLDISMLNPLGDYQHDVWMHVHVFKWNGCNITEEVKQGRWSQCAHKLWLLLSAFR